MHPAIVAVAQPAHEITPVQLWVVRRPEALVLKLLQVTFPSQGYGRRTADCAHQTGYNASSAAIGVLTTQKSSDVQIRKISCPRAFARHHCVRHRWRPGRA